MAGGKKMMPRKRPVQQRAVVTVDAIVEAAAYILVKEGWDRFTTNRVAERAGVNIASIYQYFPNKDAILAELQRRHRSSVRHGLPDIRPALQAQRSLRGRLKLIVDAAVRAHRVEPALHRAFAEELPRSVQRHDASDEADETRLWQAMLRPYLKNLPDADVAIFLCRVASEAAIHEAVSARPELLESPHFADELTTLLERYVRRPAR